MPPPKSTADLLTRLGQSGLIPPADLAAAAARVPSFFTPPDVLELFVADRLLTQFQADRLAAGKYKGFVLGSYVILDKLGGGGMGQVFLAEHADMRRHVAIKVLPLPALGDTVARERFLREARAAAALDHPNIVRAFDLSRDGGMYYLIMEYVEGVSLQALVARAGPLAPGVAADYARQVADGLQHAHERGLVHRDVKPANILVERHGVVRLLDLGLVRSADDTDSQLTALGRSGNRSILGTPDYLAPEQALDSSSVDTRADVYSLGATLYFLLAGHPMFPEGRTAQKLMWQQWKDPTPITTIRPDVPAGLAEILHVALAKRPDERFQTPQDFADALSGWATGPHPPDPALIPPPPPRRAIRSTPDPAAQVGAGTASGTSRVRDSSASWAFRPSTDPNQMAVTPTVIPPPAPRKAAAEVITLGPGNGSTSHVTSLPPVRWKTRVPPDEARLDPIPKPSSSVVVTDPAADAPAVAPTAADVPEVPRLKPLFPAGRPLRAGAVIRLGPPEAAADTPRDGTANRTPSGSTRPAPPPGLTPTESDIELPTVAGLDEWQKSRAAAGEPRRRSGTWVLAGVVVLVLGGLAAAVLGWVP